MKPTVVVTSFSYHEGGQIYFIIRKPGLLEFITKDFPIKWGKLNKALCWQSPDAAQRYAEHFFDVTFDL